MVLTHYAFWKLCYLFSTWWLLCLQVWVALSLATTKAPRKRSGVDQEPTENMETTTTSKPFVNLFHDALSSSNRNTAKYRRIASYQMQPGRYLTICFGSVVDFESSKGVIVNAANETCLGGTGVDGAITEAGGPSLVADREALPVIKGIRCPTTHAKLLGPNHYGILKVPYVAMTVGVDFRKMDVMLGNDLLGACYTNVMGATYRNEDIEQVAFCLISAGAFRGNNSLNKIAESAIASIYKWSIGAMQHDYVTDVVLFVYTNEELNKVMTWADILLEGCVKVCVA